MSETDLIESPPALNNAFSSSICEPDFPVCYNCGTEFFSF